MKFLLWYSESQENGASTDIFFIFLSSFPDWLFVSVSSKTPRQVRYLRICRSSVGKSVEWLHFGNNSRPAYADHLIDYITSRRHRWSQISISVSVERQMKRNFSILASISGYVDGFLMKYCTKLRHWNFFFLISSNSLKWTTASSSEVSKLSSRAISCRMLRFFFK